MGDAKECSPMGIASCCAISEVVYACANLLNFDLLKFDLQPGNFGGGK